MPKLARLLMLLCCVKVAFAATTAPEDPPADAEVGYYALKPSVVANLNGGPDYIRCDIQLMTKDAERLAEIELHAAALRHEIFLLLADEDGPALQTPQGKEDLRRRLRDALRQVLEKRTGDPLIAEIYFTSYYVQ
jgi:flagellar FliL protein